MGRQTWNLWPKELACRPELGCADPKIQLQINSRAQGGSRRVGRVGRGPPNVFGGHLRYSDVIGFMTSSLLNQAHPVFSCRLPPWSLPSYFCTHLIFLPGYCLCWCLLLSIQHPVWYHWWRCLGCLSSLPEPQSVDLNKYWMNNNQLEYYQLNSAMRAQCLSQARSNY